MVDLTTVIPTVLQVTGMTPEAVDRYLAVDAEVGTLFVSSMQNGDQAGFSVLTAVMSGLRFSEPLRRSIIATTAMSGTKSWDEQGMHISWHFHPDIGTNLSVINHH